MHFYNRKAVLCCWLVCETRVACRVVKSCCAFSEWRRVFLVVHLYNGCRRKHMAEPSKSNDMIFRRSLHAQQEVWGQLGRERGCGKLSSLLQPTGHAKKFTATATARQRLARSPNDTPRVSTLHRSELLVVAGVVVERKPSVRVNRAARTSTRHG